MNEDVYKMIDTLHARLDDVRVAVDALQVDAAGYAKRLDKVDDSIYLIQRDLEKLAESNSAESADSSEAGDDVECAAKDAESDGEESGFLSDEMKDNLKDAGKTMAGIYRDGKEVVSELSGTMNEIKGLFKFK